LKRQKDVILLLYAAFASFALAEFSPEHRWEMYERLGLRATAYGDRPPEIELTLDPNALPSHAKRRQDYSDDDS
jgi:hypothetical protein